VTLINGTPAEWTRETWRWWFTCADGADPKYQNQPVTQANYYTPRPYRNAYDQGSPAHGFVYTVGGRHVFAASLPSLPAAPLPEVMP
jgi:hypothetical protein